MTATSTICSNDYAKMASDAAHISNIGIYNSFPEALHWEEIERDVNSIQEFKNQIDAPGDNRSVVAKLASEPLWPNSIPAEIDTSWKDLKSLLVDSAEDIWEVWTDWYEDRLSGHRPVIEELEIERVRIPDVDWDEGPAHVNAIIARLIEEHTPKPKAPEQALTPVRFEFREGKFRKAPPDAPSTPQERRRAVEQARNALAEVIDRALAENPGNNSPALGWTLQRCRDSLGSEFDALEVVSLGVFAEQLNQLAQRADEILMPEAAAAVVASNAQLQFFLRQFPEWAEYLRGIEQAFGTKEAESKAVEAANDAIAAIVASDPEIVADDAKEELDAYSQAATPEETPDGTTEPMEIARRSYLRVAGDFLAKYAGQAFGWVWTPIGKGAQKGLEKQAEATVVAGLAAAKSYLLVLADVLPAEFAWLAPAMAYLARMVGPSKQDRAKSKGNSDGDDPPDP